MSETWMNRPQCGDRVKSVSVPCEQRLNLSRHVVRHRIHQTCSIRQSRRRNFESGAERDERQYPVTGWKRERFNQLQFAVRGRPLEDFEDRHRSIGSDRSRDNKLRFPKLHTIHDDRTFIDDDESDQERVPENGSSNGTNG